MAESRTLENFSVPSLIHANDKDKPFFDEPKIVKSNIQSSDVFISQIKYQEEPTPLTPSLPISSHMLKLNQSEPDTSFDPTPMPQSPVVTKAEPSNTANFNHIMTPSRIAAQRTSNKSDTGFNSTNELTRNAHVHKTLIEKYENILV